MDHIRQTPAEQEPMGIIISRGPRGDETSRFSAYVWSDVPERQTEPTTRRAA